MTVEIHDDHFPQDCDDDEWIAAVTKRGWVILTKDKRIRKRTGHLQALKHARSAAFVLTSGGMSAEGMAATFARARTAMVNRVRKYTRPLIVTVAAAGGLTVIHGKRRGSVRRQK